LTLAVAAAAQLPTFYFAANDEFIDMACKTIPGALVAFGCRLASASLQYGEGQTDVTPLRLAEDDDEGTVENIVNALEHFPGISLEQTVNVEGGLRLYENPVKHWPPDAGNVTETLGLGTWDPFADFESQFDVVFTTGV
jgi:hypothetical protein